MKVRTVLRGIFWSVVGVVYVSRAQTPRARMALINEQNELLLIKNRFGLGEWELPGGGVRKNETAKQAAIRETKEELGVTLGGHSVKELGVHETTHRFAAMRLAVYVAKVKKDIVLHRSVEIEDTKWFALSELPADDNANFMPAIEVYRRGV